MTQEQREHIATTIALMDMAAAILQDHKSSAASLLVDQCERLQAMLDVDREEEHE